MTILDDKINEIETKVRSSQLKMPCYYDYHYRYWANVIPLIGNNGLWMEFGVFRGRSIQRISSLHTHVIYGFDSFNGLHEAWDASNPKGSYDSGGIIPAGAIVGDNHSMFDRSPTKQTEPWNINVRLIKGYFEDTLPEFLKEHPEKAAFLHIDSDLYSSCVTILTNMKDRIVNGTIICFDDFIDFGSYREGEMKAFAEFLIDTGLGFDSLIYHGAGTEYAQACVRIKSI